MSRETTAPSLESWVNSPDACCFGLYLKWCFISYFVWKLTFFTFTRRLYKDQTWQSYLKMIYFSRMIVSWKQDQEHNFVGIYITCFCIWKGGGGSKLIQCYKIVHTTCNLFVPLSKKTLLGNQGPTLHPFGSFAVYWVGAIQKENSCWILYKKLFYERQLNLCQIWHRARQANLNWPELKIMEGNIRNETS